MPRGTADDELFGGITWVLEPDRLRLGGDRVPDVEIVRTGDEPALQYVPIGTRRPAALRMTVDDSPVDLVPGPGRLSRRSYRIAVGTAVGPLLSTPCSPTASRLVRGASYRGDNELGVFERLPDGSPGVTWSSEVRALGLTVRAPTPTPTEAAIGHAVALAFGTGAQFFLPALLSAVGRMIPG